LQLAGLSDISGAGLFGVTPARYPETPGFKSGATSREAAIKIAPRAGTLRRQVLAEFAAVPDGATADEIAQILDRTAFAVRPRVSELLKLGFIVPTDNRRENPSSGMSAMVYRVSESGLRLVETGR
jgi:hypothetical protein